MNPSRQTNEPDLCETLQDECICMAKHALASGLSVPAVVLETLQEVESQSSSDQPAIGIDRIGAAHQVLAQLVSPATPRAIALFAHQRTRSGWLHYLGPIPLVRWLMAAAIFFLILLNALSMSPDTVLIDEQGNAVKGWSIFSSSGTELLIRLSFLMSAAGLGACFAERCLQRIVTSSTGLMIRSTPSPIGFALCWV